MFLLECSVFMYIDEYEYDVTTFTSCNRQIQYIRHLKSSGACRISLLSFHLCAFLPRLNLLLWFI